MLEKHYFKFSISSSDKPVILDITFISIFSSSDFLAISIFLSFFPFASFSF